MVRGASDVVQGLEALRAAVLAALTLEPALAVAAPGSHSVPSPRSSNWLLTEVSSTPDVMVPGPGGFDDSDLAASSEEDEADRERLIALVELARTGDKDAFGL